MGTIVSSFFISLDGVVQSPDQWHVPYWNDEMSDAVTKSMEATEAILTGPRAIRRIGLMVIDGSIQAKRDERFVDDGDIITSAGISAGIDMALHLIVRLHSAYEIRRRIQYEPEPPV